MKTFLLLVLGIGFAVIVLDMIYTVVIRTWMQAICESLENHKGCILLHPNEESKEMCGFSAEEFKIELTYAWHDYYRKLNTDNLKWFDKIIYATIDRIIEF